MPSRRWILGLASILLAVATIACSGRIPSPPRSTTDSLGEPSALVMIGDSIFAQLKGQLTNRTIAGHEVHVAAVGKRMTREQLNAARRWAGLRPSVVVINLGTNDQLCAIANFRHAVDPAVAACRYAGFTGPDAEQDLREMVALFEAKTCILGVTLVSRPAPPSIWHRMLSEGRIEAIVDWQAHVAELPSGGLLKDGLGHLTQKGVVALIQLVDESVSAHCPAD